MWGWRGPQGSTPRVPPILRTSQHGDAGHCDGNQRRLRFGSLACCPDRAASLAARLGRSGRGATAGYKQGRCWPAIRLRPEVQEPEPADYGRHTPPIPQLALGRAVAVSVELLGSSCQGVPARFPWNRYWLSPASPQRSVGGCPWRTDQLAPRRRRLPVRAATAEQCGQPSPASSPWLAQPPGQPWCAQRSAAAPSPPELRTGAKQRDLPAFPSSVTMNSTRFAISPLMKCTSRLRRSSLLTSTGSFAF